MIVRESIGVRIGSTRSCMSVGLAAIMLLVVLVVSSTSSYETSPALIVDANGHGSQVVDEDEERREEGVEHNVINGGSAEMSFVEVELK